MAINLLKLYFMKLTIYTDGGARGNPGPAAAGVVIKNEAGKILAAYGEYLGKQTNNFAEYSALISGLKSPRAGRARSGLYFRQRAGNQTNETRI